MSHYRPIAEALPRLHPSRAELQTRIIGALNRRRWGELTVGAQTASDTDRRAASAWLRFRTRNGAVSIAPLLVEGHMARVTAAPGEPDAIAAAALLTPIDPLLAALETVLGDELHPDGLAADISPTEPVIALNAGPTGGEPHTRLLVAFSDQSWADPVAILPLDRTALGRVQLDGWISIDGPRIAVTQLAGLAAGDLVVLGLGPLGARLSFSARDAGFGGWLDMGKGNLIVQEPITAPADAPGAEAEARVAEYTIATTIELAGPTRSVAELASIGPGSVVPLPATGGTLAVKLRAGGAVVAEGELVAVGDGFGVLVTRRNDGGGN